MRRLKPKEKKSVGDFRLLRFLPLDVNVQRFVKHMARVRRRLHADPVFRKLCLKSRRLTATPPACPR